MKRIRILTPEPGESVVWDIGVGLFHYLLLSICMAGVLL
jgi:hypothetical protein